MSKSKTDSVEMVNVADEMQQIEDSVLLAGEFINDVLLPQLDEFENENDDPDYMTGMATHGLFVELIQRMAEMGYTARDLRREIKIYLTESFGETLH